MEKSQTSDTGSGGRARVPPGSPSPVLTLLVRDPVLSLTGLKDRTET